MLSASTRTTGQSVASPDTCQTPTGTGVDAPVPYVNTASHSQAVAFSTTVMIENGNALTQATSIPSTSGDEAGVDHPVTRQEARYTLGNPIVFIEQMPAITLSSLSTGNAMNASVGSVTSPSASTVFFTRAEGAASPGATLSTRELAELAQIARGDATTVYAVADGATIHSGPIHLVITLFTSDVGVLVARALGSLRRAKGARISIDLRGNPGGDLDAALALANDFLGEGHVLARVRDADGDVEARRSWGIPRYVDPVELLIDERTASAAEVFVDALVHAGRARATGGPMYGKSTVQRVVHGADGLTRYATVATVLSRR
jgi:carboxyl-terminal processing protease